MTLFEYMTTCAYNPDGPECVAHQVTDFAIARIGDYSLKGSDYEYDLFEQYITDDYDLEGVVNLYEALKTFPNLNQFEYLSAAYNLLSTELNDNIVSNLEKACDDYYDTMLASDIDYLLLDEPWENVQQYITKE